MKDSVQRSATISPCGKYRYSLRRVWADENRIACFVMLNPSTADAEIDDPTIRRCIGFAKAWHFDALEVVNLFAWRSTDPAALQLSPDAIGPENDAYIEQAADRAALVVCAWGADPFAKTQALALSAMLKRRVLYCVGKNQDGSPKHPLYARSIDQPLLWRGALL